MRFFRTMVLFCILLSFAGCMISGMPQGEGWTIEEGDFIPAEQWPENEYTKQIPQPEYGEVEYINDWSDEGRFGLWLDNIEREEADQEVDELKQYGDGEISQEGNFVSVGVMLQKEDIYLSIAYSGSGLGIIITMESENRTTP